MTVLILIGPSLLKHTGVSFPPTLRIEETEIGSPSFLSFYSSSQQQRNKQIRSDRFFSQQVFFSFLISHQSKTPISFYIYMSLYHVIYINVYIYMFFWVLSDRSIVWNSCVYARNLVSYFFKIFAKLDRFCFVISDPNSVIWDLRQSVQISFTIRSEFMSFLNKFYSHLVAEKKVVIEEKLKLWDHISIIC